MPTTVITPQTEIKGYETRRLRLAVNLTRQQIAELAGVPPEHVLLLEKHLPVPLDSKRRVLGVLWAAKVRKQRRVR